ncbi:MAG: hypothetical protein ACR2KV_14260 [Solirubrobacteraceae bacterium]
MNYTLVAQRPAVRLQTCFGRTARFPLAATLPVDPGDVVAPTVPTWAPALALGFGHDTSRRATRPRTACANTGLASTQTAIGSTVQYYCLYGTARLTYSATLAATP